VNDLDQSFEVTHPFHPLHRRRFALVVRRHDWGRNRVHFYDDNGRLISLPAQWTSVSLPDPFVVLSAGRSAFRYADLLALARMIAELESGGER
jgi:hypothetical protein